MEMTDGMAANGKLAIAMMGCGFCWEELEVGQQLQTFRRTVTETDLVNFISTTGMLESIFIDAEGAATGIGGRPVPAALTYTLIEGFILQAMIQGTGLAMLELTQKVLGQCASATRASRL